MTIVENSLELKQGILSIRLSKAEDEISLIKDYLEYQIDALTQHHQKMNTIIWDAQELYFQYFKSYYPNSICRLDDKFTRWTIFIEENLLINEYYYSDDLIRAINDVYFDRSESIFNEIITNVYEGIEKPALNSLLQAECYLYKMDLNYDKKKFARVENKTIQEIGLEEIPTPQWSEELQDFVDYSYLFHLVEGRFIQESDVLHLNRFNSIHSTLNQLNQIYLTLRSQNYNFRNFPFVQELATIPDADKADLRENVYLLFLYLFARSKNKEYRTHKTQRDKFYVDISEAENGNRSSMFYHVVRSIKANYNVNRTAGKSHLLKRLFDLRSSGNDFQNPLKLDNKIPILTNIDQSIKLANSINTEIEKLSTEQEAYFPDYI